MRDPEDITHNGKTVRQILDDHAKWLRGEGGERADLERAILRDADLRRAILRGANLRDADLSDANLYGADLSDAILSGAKLCDANLRDADLRWADLRRAILRGADLRRAILRGANLRDADLSEANLYGADLSDAILSGAKLDGTIGNMREIKSAQFDEWPLTWTQAKSEDVVLQIGCQKHPLAMWEKSDPEWIDQMDEDATDWWTRHREIVLALVKASPPVPYEWKGAKT